MRDALRLMVWIPGRAAVRLLPDAATFWCFERMGDIHGMLSPSSSRRIASRIRLTVDGTEEMLGREARAHLRNHYVDRLHIFLYPRLSKRGRRPGWLGLEGRETLDRALSRRRGVLLVHPHFAVPQLLPLALGLEGYPCMQIGLPSAQGLSRVGRSVAFRTRVSLERMLPARILPADRFLRPAFEWLRKGNIVCITGDGAGGGRFVGRQFAVPFLGQRVLMPAGPAKLALLSNAALLPAIVQREGRGRYVARIEEEMPVPSAGDPKRAHSDLTTAFARWLDERVRSSPGLWHFWNDLTEGNLLAPPQGA